MVKVALLIGISEYESGLASLPGSLKDIRAMERVLQHSAMGSFDQVKLLENPGRMEMEGAIESLFSGHQPDDLILLYFSGHGIKEEDGSLYLATRQTIFVSGELITTTAVETRIVQRFMSKSRSKQQVLILDCCFSGAFAEGMTARRLTPVPVDISGQLSAEGRAVLTSSTDTQSSFEDENGGIYTRYIVEGIEKGAADTNNDGWITVDELHEFARGKTQEAKPVMKPEIYAVREGYKIQLAKAPVGDPKVEYRKEIERLAKERNGRFSPILLKGLDERCKASKLVAEEAEAILSEVLQPYREFESKLQRYEQALVEEWRKASPLSDQARRDLLYFQKALGLRDEDIQPIEVRVVPPITVFQPEEVPDQDQFREVEDEVTQPSVQFSSFYQFAVILMVFSAAVFVVVFVGVSVIVPALSPSKDGMKAEEWFSRAYEKVEQGDLKGGIADYTQAIALKPNDAYAYHLMRGLAHYNLGDKQAAIADYNKAIELKPDLAEAYNHRGIAHDNLGDQQAAIADLNKAIALKPDLAVAAIPNSTLYRRFSVSY